MDPSHIVFVKRFITDVQHCYKQRVIDIELHAGIHPYRVYDHVHMEMANVRMYGKDHLALRQFLYCGGYLLKRFPSGVLAFALERII